MIKCVIIEDEKNAQKLLKNYIAKTPSLQCQGVWESTLNVPKSILSDVDFIFLDMELPELNGLDFIRTLENPPKVIITTAYPQYAVDAFELAVIDYLMKPFSYQRFLTAIERLKNNIEIDPDKHLLVYANKTTHKVTIGEIQYIKSELDYVCIVTHKEKIMLLGSLTNWEQKMAAYNFVRIHRSYIINMDSILKVYKNSLLVGETEIPIGKRYKESFLDAFTKHNI
ncbi:MAG TPA: DNA-binding response regulator [Microscillaceae bacterium]|nr:DNA-binding response regulator [Microscillaceae bacterium]